MTTLANVAGTVLLDNFGGSGNLSGRMPDGVALGGFPWGYNSTGFTQYGTVSGGFVQTGADAINYSDNLAEPFTSLQSYRVDFAVRTGDVSAANIYGPWLDVGNARANAGSGYGLQYNRTVIYLNKHSTSGYWGAAGWVLEFEHHVQDAAGVDIGFGTLSFLACPTLSNDTDYVFTFQYHRGNAVPAEMFLNGAKIGEFPTPDTSSLTRPLSYAYVRSDNMLIDAFRISPADPYVGTPPDFWTSFVGSHEVP